MTKRQDECLRDRKPVADPQAPPSTPDFMDDAFDLLHLLEKDHDMRFSRRRFSLKGGDQFTFQAIQRVIAKCLRQVYMRGVEDAQ